MGHPKELFPFRHCTLATGLRYNVTDPIGKPIRDRHDNALREVGPELLVAVRKGILIPKADLLLLEAMGGWPANTAIRSA